MSLLQQATTAVIASGASDSAAVALGNLTLLGISVPSLTSAAAITIRVSSDGGTTYQGLFNAAGEVSYASDASSKYLAVNPNDIIGADFIKIRSGTNGSAVTQTVVGGTTFILHVREKR